MIPVLFSDPGSGKSRNALALVFFCAWIVEISGKKVFFASSGKELFWIILDNFIEVARWAGEGQEEA